MKSIAFLMALMLLGSFKPTKNDYISLEYTGNSDYPMPVVYISKKPILFSELSAKIEKVSGLPENYIVYDNEFLQIKRLLYMTNNGKIDRDESNGFMITVQENHLKKNYFVTRTNSNLLFLKIKAFLSYHESRNKELIETLEGLRTTNVFR